MILACAFRTLLVVAALIIHVLPVSSVAQTIHPLIKVDISVTHAADLPTDGGATVTVQGKFLDFLNFRPSVSIGGHACSRTYWMVNNPRSVTVSASIGCESPPGYGSADLRVDFYDHQLDSLVAWGQSAKSVRYLPPIVTAVSPSVISIPATEKVLVSIDGRNLGEAHASPYAAVYVEGSSVGQVVHRSSTVVMVMIEAEMLNQLSRRGSSLDVTLVIGNRPLPHPKALTFCFSESSCEKRGVVAPRLPSRSLLASRRSLLSAPVVTRINPVKSAPAGGSAIFIY